MFWRSPAPSCHGQNLRELDRDIEQACQFVKQRAELTPRVGIVLGSGLGPLVQSVQDATTIAYNDIPGFPQVTAMGHAGRLVLGTWNGIGVAVMQGRYHFYEGYSADVVTTPVRLLHSIGVESLILTNASGGMNPDYSAGDIMILNDHINLMPSFIPGNSASTQNFSSTVYDQQWCSQAERVGIEDQLQTRTGVYVGVPGPNYETPAEYRMYRDMGGDVVGMSTVFEASLARQLGLRTLGLSVVTNVYNPDSTEPTTGEEVLDVASHAATRMSQLIGTLLAEMAD